MWKAQEKDGGNTEATRWLREDDECSGYEEKLPAHIHEGNVVKLSILMQELLSFEEACQYLERQIAADDSGQAMKEFH